MQHLPSSNNSSVGISDSGGGSRRGWLWAHCPTPGSFELLNRNEAMEAEKIFQQLQTSTTKSGVNNTLLHLRVWGKTFDISQLIIEDGGGSDVGKEGGGGESCSIMLRSPDNTLLRYRCSWFFRDDEGCWSPMAPHLNQGLDAAHSGGIGVILDGEREYDLQSLQSVNCVSHRARPLLHIVSHEEGIAVTGKCVVDWAIAAPSTPPPSSSSITGGGAAEVGPGPKSVPLPLFACEALESGIATFIASSASSSSKATTSLFTVPGVISLRGQKYQLQVNISFCAHHEHMPATLTLLSGQQRMETSVTRYLATWMYLNDNGSAWHPIDFNTMRLLDLASAADRPTLRDHEREYLLKNHTQRNLMSQVERPLLQVRSRVSAVVGTPLSQIRSKYPDVAKRLCDMMVPRTGTASLLTDINSGDRRCIARALVNVLVNQYSCVVKGGIVRDAAVLNVDTFKDIDAEMDPSVNPNSVDRWLKKFVQQTEATFGLVFQTSTTGRKWNFRTSFDGIAGKQVTKGIVTLVVERPTSIEIELVTPWNIAYAPPRNVDVSASNLRIIPALIAAAASSSSSAATPPGNPMLYQNVAIGLSTNTIIETIQKYETHPVYDVKFIPGKNSETGDGIDLNLWAVGEAPTAARSKAMSNRLKAMRGKGFRFIPLPHTAPL